MNKSASNIVHRALHEPLRHISENAALEEAAIRLRCRQGEQLQDKQLGIQRPRGEVCALNSGIG
jgi:hypothetical protein